MPELPPPAAAPEVVCCICGQLWDARDPGITYRSIDRRWWCADDQACLEWASRAAILAASPVRTDPATLAKMYRALDASWAALWARMGWNA